LTRMVVPMETLSRPTATNRLMVGLDASLELYLRGTFADYTNFNNGSNTSTPRPTWTASNANTRVSTTVPLSETHYEAMDFAAHW